MDLKRIENIIRIAEEKNITRAADKLSLSQPALNLQLLNLEKELGTKLFYRRGNEWSISEAGRIYVDTARKMVALKKDCYSRISDVAKLHNEEIAVGAAGIQGDIMMTALYKKFHNKYPNVKLQLNIMKGLKTQELVKNGTIDLGIILMGDKQNYHLEYEFLAHVEMVLVMSESSPYAELIERDHEGNEIVDLKKFKNVPFVLGPKDSTERFVSERAFEKAGIEPDIYMDVEGINYEMAMVTAGECCAILGENNLKDSDMHGIHAVRLKSHPVMNAFAVYRKDKYLSDPMSDLIELARDYWTEKSS
jgi:DNA-binding transcriptional LysR family regulator